MSPAPICSMKSLNEGLEFMSMISKYALKQSEYLKKGGNSMTKWTSNNDNVALKDVMEKTNEVFSLFSEKLINFANEYDKSIKSIKIINDNEKLIKDVEKKLGHLIEEEKNMEKEIRKYGRSSMRLFKSKKLTTLAIMHHDLKKIRNAKAVSEKELSDIVAEMEVAKMYRFRKGMEGIAVAWKNLAIDMVSIFTCQQKLVDNVPAIVKEDVRELVYEGSEQTKIIVEDLKEKLKRHNSCIKTPNVINKRNIFIKQRSHDESHKNEPSSPPPSAPTFERSLKKKRPFESSFSHSIDSTYSSCDSLNGKIIIPMNPFVQQELLEKEAYMSCLYPKLPKLVYNEKLACTYENFPI
uniref:Uncharacterized protein n=1 Tax=Parastrongyloides trichosuri TaxID=131310 RepID=A0A0N4ZL39_PARTI